MLKLISMACVLGLVLVVVGCSKEEEKKTVPAVPAAPTTQPKVDMPKVDMPKVDVPKVDVPKVDVPKIDQAAVTKEGQGLMDKVTQAIKDKKWDDAEAALKKLEGMKGSLPADWAAKIDALRTSLTTAKAAGGAPALPGGLPN